MGGEQLQIFTDAGDIPESRLYINYKHPLPIQSLGMTVAEERDPNKFWVSKFGRNPSVGNTEELVWDDGGSYTGFLTSASSVRVRAGGNANDTASGTGARKIRVYGLDSNFDLAEEDIDLNGSLASSATTISFIRVFRLRVCDVGTYGGTNEGNILVETTGGVLLCSISAGISSSRIALYSVPRNCEAYLISVDIHVEGNFSASLTLWKHENIDVVTAPFSPKIFVLGFDESVGYNSPNTVEFLKFTEKTDIYFTAEKDGVGSDSAVDARFSLILKKVI
jgi:hypothetical protein